MMPWLTYLFLGILLVVLVQTSSWLIYQKTHSKKLALLPTGLFFLVGLLLTAFIYVIALVETTALASIALTSLLSLVIGASLISLTTSLLLCYVFDLRNLKNSSQKTKEPQ